MNNNFILKFSILVLLLANHCYGAKDDIQHENLGCPFNSTCSVEMGNIFHEWSNQLKELKNKPVPKQITLIEKFRKKKGIPLTVFTEINRIDSNSPPLVIWDSYCEDHRNKKKHTIQYSKIFVINMLNNKIKAYGPNGQIQLEHNQKIILRPILQWSQNQGDKINTYYFPVKNTPDLILDGNLGTILEEEGVFFVWTQSPSGQIKITPAQNLTEHYIDENKASCPKKLQDYYEKTFSSLSTVFSQFYCISYNVNINHKKILQYLLIPYSC